MIKIHKCLEPLGLLLLLFSFGWECFANRMEKINQEGLIIELHKKVDDLWACHYMNYTRSTENKTTSSSLIDMDSTNTGWLYSGEKLCKQFNLVNRQVSTGGIVRTIFYILGSILIIASKYLAIVKLKE